MNVMPQWVRCESCGESYINRDGHTCDTAPLPITMDPEPDTVKRAARIASAVVVILGCCVIGSGMIWLIVLIWKAILG